MDRLLKLLGYTNDIEVNTKFAYIINSVSIGMVTLFFVFYIMFANSIILNIATTVCLMIFIYVYVLLKKKRLLTAKLLLMIGFFFQEFSIVFLWFPNETNFNYFFFIIAPITFFIYNIDIKIEKIFLFTFNILAIVLLFLSELVVNVNPLIIIDESIITLFSSMSVLSTISSITIVYFFYGRTLTTIHKELKLLANTDALTSILNRRALFRAGEELFEACKKRDLQFTLILIDIDFFKDVNDSYGHPVGDEILVQLTELITTHIRRNDIFSRYGGEEFAIILKNTEESDNEKTATMLGEFVRDHDFIVSDGTVIKLTISLGVVTSSSKYSDFSSLVKLADKALYEAKERGRNRAIKYSDELLENC
ncbi:MAG: GGDEF domain-containing protein [Spirochaetaceae bacterium]